MIKLSFQLALAPII